jgi:hypothetical protein
VKFAEEKIRALYPGMELQWGAKFAGPGLQPHYLDADEQEGTDDDERTGDIVTIMKTDLLK